MYCNMLCGPLVRKTAETTEKPDVYRLSEDCGSPSGAGLLRHSLATQLVERRRPINEVADLLGHRSINTTALYVKVATSQLADVALPFPGDAA